MVTPSNTLTVPWSDDELIWVGKTPFTYTYDKNNREVHMHNRYKVPITRFIQDNPNAKLPGRWRTSSY